jgi:FkbM family methyltransferase
VFDIYFNGKTGVLWDFGCNDGLTYSNSHYLLKACGWGGVLLDASETCIRKARSLYPGREDIQFLNLGIAPQSGVFSFHESGNHLGKSDHGLVSSFIKEETARFLPYTEYETKNVRCVDLNEFIGNESVYKRADLISIDVEGMDYSILSQIDLNQTETQVVCVENNGCDAGRFVRYCKKFGLIQIYESSENLVFGRKKIKIPSDSKASGRLDWMRSKFRKIVSQFR